MKWRNGVMAAAWRKWRKLNGVMKMQSSAEMTWRG